ncbi:hypothetical protein Desmu_0461 [Desulfurococcus mucosus DSM 2162]|uniref:Uncharacterized protein n=1 Tax=Desulfurococcus mucosus (strain ATCC 35584 / DSM 2162 / JCM 9187 / O7/1) TaxID=765177 RepID=E8R8E9_DESM0|nr:hypothetical protein Desmu_0461 [Desulfurococcus mucosus DSM 2162]
MGGEGFLTLCAVFRVSPEPVETPRPLAQMGVSDHPDCPADDGCSPEQMRGTSEPPKGKPPLGRGGGQMLSVRGSTPYICEPARSALQSYRWIIGDARYLAFLECIAHCFAPPWVSSCPGGS